MALVLKQELEYPQDTEIVSQPLSLTFSNLPLPRELIFEILHHWMAPESLIVEYEQPLPQLAPEASSTPGPALDSSAPDRYHVTYACATDGAVMTLPADFQDEYWRIRHLSYLKSVKTFKNPYDFYMSHHLLSIDPTTKLPPFSALPRTPTWSNVTIHPLLQLSHPHVTLHGLEHVELDFDALQYFAFFNVGIPPFDFADTTSHGDELHHDPHVHGAALLLQHAKHLLLHFGDAYKWSHPWADVKNSAWSDACCRPNVCESGIVVDWILEYAWLSNYLQHLDGFEIRGDIQEWVKGKWTRIFEEHRSRRGDGKIGAFAVHEPDVVAIERFGMQEDDGEEDWKPEEHYPPVCECAIGCWRLQGGEVLEDRPDGGWDDEMFGTLGDGLEVVIWDDVSY